MSDTPTFDPNDDAWSPAVVEAGLAVDAAEVAYSVVESRAVDLLGKRSAARSDKDKEKMAAIEVAIRAAQIELDLFGDALRNARVHHSFLVRQEQGERRVARDRANAEAQERERAERLSLSTSRTKALLEKFGL